MGCVWTLHVGPSGGDSATVAHPRTGVLVRVVGIPSGYYDLRASALVGASRWTRHCQGRALLGEDQRQKLGRLGTAAVLRNLVRGAGRLVEHLARFIDPLRLA